MTEQERAVIARAVEQLARATSYAQEVSDEARRVLRITPADEFKDFYPAYVSVTTAATEAVGFAKAELARLLGMGWEQVRGLSPQEASEAREATRKRIRHQAEQSLREGRAPQH